MAFFKTDGCIPPVHSLGVAGTRFKVDSVISGLLRSSKMAATGVIFGLFYIL
jgi:hypothetical protein